MMVGNIEQNQYNKSGNRWGSLLLPEFEIWLKEQERQLQKDILFIIGKLEIDGPSAGRPLVDTFKGSKLPNLKELRFEYKGAPIRILFAFDPKRQAVIILGGNKEISTRWYKINIPKAEKLYLAHLQRLKDGK